MSTPAGARRYSAFISYRHHAVDRFSAIKVMRALESFSTPHGLRKQGYPAKLDPLFRDDDEAGAHGSLSDQLREALTNSKALIVICTSRTPESEWIEREIAFFKQLGRADNIIPVVVEGEPSVVVPASLRDGQSGWSSNELLAVDLREQEHEPAPVTWRRGIQRIAAALLECRYDDLAQRAETERRRTRFRQGAIAGVAAGLLALGALFWWDATLRIKHEYFANYVEHWGVPVGVGRLSNEEVRHRSDSARIATQGGRVIEFARVNGLGALQTGAGTEVLEPWADSVARWTYTYRNDGTLASSTAYDQSGKEIRRLTFEFAEDRSTAVFRIQNGVGHAEMFSGSATSAAMSDRRGDGGEFEVQHSLVGQHRMTFDSAGFPLREIYEPLQGGAPVADAGGVAGRAFAYDQAGNLSEIRNLGVDGQPDQTPGKAVMMVFTYDSRGQSLAREFRSSTGVLVNGPAGVARVTLMRDRYGNDIETRTFDANGAPVAGGDWGAPRTTTLYDEHGNPIEHRAFDANNNPTYAGEDRASIWRSRYDDRGRNTEQSFFDASGAPLSSRSLQLAAIRWEFDSGDRVIAEHAFGTDGQPTLGGSGAATIRMRYDERGNISEQSYHGADGRLTRNRFGVAIERFSYDDQDRLLRERWFGPDNRPAETSFGIFGMDYAYDNLGNISQTNHVGADGRPLENFAGVASRRFAYDNAGRLIETRNLDASGATTFDESSDVAIERYTFDSRGQLTERSSFGRSGEPIFAADTDAHARQMAYDSRGYLTRETDLGRSREVLTIWTQQADDRGRPISVSTWGPNYTPQTSGAFNGAHQLRLAYDVHGQLTSLVNIQTSGLPGPDFDGVTQRSRTYDARGNLIEERNLDSAGFLVSDLNTGAAIIRHSYDTAGRKMQTQLLGVFGSLISTGRYTRDAMGRVVRIETRDGAGAPREINGVAARAYTYAANGRCTRELSYNAVSQVIHDLAVDVDEECPR